jgi:hypothetical protein
MTVQDPSDTPIDAAAEAPSDVARQPRGRSVGRWGVARVVAVLVVGVVLGAALILLGGSSPSTLAGWAPKDSVVFADVRLDLPGDQRQKLGQVLSKFPGFADQSTLDAKLSDVFDRIVRSASNGAQDYSTKIKPWFGGELAIAARPYPKSPVGSPAPTASGGSHLAAESRGVGILTVTDPAKAKAWFVSTLGDQPHATDTHSGVDLIVGGQPATWAMAIVGGRAMLVGDVDSVKAAIDTQGTSGLATSTRFGSAQAQLHGDSLGTFYVDEAALAEFAAKAGSGATSPGASSPASSSPSGSSLLQLLSGRIPDWAVGQLRAESDAVVVETVMPHVSTGPQRQNRLSNVASHLPLSTIAVLDAHDVGPRVLDIVDAYRKDPASADTLKQIDSTTALFGGLEGLVGWIGDTDVVVTRDGEVLSGGIVVAPTDKAAATRLLASIKGLVALAGAGQGLATTDQAYAGTTITSIDLSGLIAKNLPAGGQTLPTGTPTTIAYAESSDIVVIGVGDVFVKAVLDVKPGSSLADGARYKGLIDRVGSKNASSFYVDVASARDAAEAFAAKLPVDLGTYRSEYRPYLVPIDAIVGATVTGDFDRSTFVMTVN